MVHPADSWLEQAGVAVHVRDGTGKGTFANPAARTLFGWPDGPFDPGDSHPSASAMVAASANGYWRGDLEREDSSGNRVVLDSSWTLLRDDTGVPIGFVVIEVDVTETRAHQAHMLRAQRLESIGTLAGGIAHEINNVLGPVLIGAELIQRRVSDPWILNKLRSIEESARRGAEIVRQVLDFARGMEGEMIVFQPRHVLKDVASFAQRTFSRSIEIRTHYRRDLDLVLGDAAQLRQLLLNLLLNARDAMRDGGTLTIRASMVDLDGQNAAALSPEARPGRHVHICVEDTGVGIPDDVQQSMFEPFFTTKSRAQGTGLGLSTAVTIVRAHHGFIHVASRPGVGTAMSVYLPAHGEQAESPEQESAIRAVAAERARRILVVDDEPAMLEMNTDMLASYGFQTVGAVDGRKGLAAFMADPHAFDAVITDVVMPGMSGSDMIREIRRVRADVPIVVVSGLPVHDHQVFASGSQDIVFLSKPYTSAQLIEAVIQNLREADDTGGDGSTCDAQQPDATSTTGTVANDSRPDDTVSDERFDDLIGGDDL